MVTYHTLPGGESIVYTAYELAEPKPILYTPLPWLAVASNRHVLGEPRDVPHRIDKIVVALDTYFCKRGRKAMMEAFT